MMKIRTMAAALMVAGLSLTLASAAGAMQTPTTGQPGAPAGTTCGSGNATSTPGNSVNATGSAFNPNGVAGTVYAGNAGTSSTLHANSTAAVSNYDIACLQVSTH